MPRSSMSSSDGAKSGMLYSSLSSAAEMEVRHAPGLSYRMVSVRFDRCTCKNPQKPYVGVAVLEYHDSDIHHNLALDAECFRCHAVLALNSCSKEWRFEELRLFLRMKLLESAREQRDSRKSEKLFDEDAAQMILITYWEYGMFPGGVDDGEAWRIDEYDPVIERMCAIRGQRERAAPKPADRRMQTEDEAHEQLQISLTWRRPEGVVERLEKELLAALKSSVGETLPSRAGTLLVRGRASGTGSESQLARREAMSRDLTPRAEGLLWPSSASSMGSQCFQEYKKYIHQVITLRAGPSLGNGRAPASERGCCQHYEKHLPQAVAPGAGVSPGGGRALGTESESLQYSEKRTRQAVTPRSEASLATSRASSFEIEDLTERREVISQDLTSPVAGLFSTVQVSDTEIESHKKEKITVHWTVTSQAEAAAQMVSVSEALRIAMQEKLEALELDDKQSEDGEGEDWQTVSGNRTKRDELSAEDWFIVEG